jgi:hypothetical protein
LAAHCSGRKEDMLIVMVGAACCSTGIMQR